MNRLNIQKAFDDMGLGSEEDRRKFVTFPVYDDMLTSKYENHQEQVFIRIDTTTQIPEKVNNAELGTNP